jgi:hypothetical protein
MNGILLYHMLAQVGLMACHWPTRRRLGWILPKSYRHNDLNSIRDAPGPIAQLGMMQAKA